MSPLSLFLIWHRLPPSDIRAPASWTFGLRQVFITSFPGSQLLEGAWWVCLASVFVGQFPQGISSGTYTRLHPLYPAAYTRLRPPYPAVYTCLRPPYLPRIHFYVLRICCIFMSTSSASAACTRLRPPHLPRIHIYVLRTCHVYMSTSWGQTSCPTCPVLCSLLPPLPTCARSSPVVTAPTMNLKNISHYGGIVSAQPPGRGPHAHPS